MIATRFAQEGAHVAAVARTKAEVQDTVKRIRKAGSRALAIRADVCKGTEVKDMIQRVRQEFGCIDALVNCAGVYGPIGPLVTLDADEWLQAVTINLGGTFLCCRAVLPAMIEAGSGKIVTLSGGGATSPRPNFSAYAASKAAVVRLTETLACEVQPYHIQVNAIAPGPIDTRMIDDVLTAGHKAGQKDLEEARRVRAGQGASPDRVVELALFLASSASDGLTGRLISAVWDDWSDSPSWISRIMNSDLYTLRRNVPGKYIPDT